MNKIFYLANYRFPTERAHGIQVVQTCQALTALGREIVLLIPNRQTAEPGDIFSYYGLRNKFIVKKLPVIDWLGWWPNRFSFFIESITFAVSSLFYLLKNYQQDVIYSRDQFSLFFLKFWPKFSLVYEMHNFPKKLNFWHRSLFKTLRFVVISHGLRRELENIGIKPSRILVAPDGVDLSTFDLAMSNATIRKQLSLPVDKKIILYAGSRQPWKGTDTLLAAANMLPDFDFYFIGGQAEKTEQANVFFLGQKPHQVIPQYLRAADLLILPNSAKEKISSDYTSPMKLFEYLASSTPILAADLPSIKEIIDELHAFFFPADNPAGLVRAIKDIFSTYQPALVKAASARKLAANFTWEKRAEKIINFLQHV